MTNQPSLWEEVAADILAVRGDGGGDEDFRERNARDLDRGAALFVSYCLARGHSLHRVGFDAKADPVPRFWELPEVVRLLPDYVVIVDGKKPYLVEVKGSPNLKLEEYETLPRRLTWYGPRYSYAFCWRGRIAVLTVPEVMARYDASEAEGRFPSDGKLYRTLDLEDRWQTIGRQQG